MLYRIIRFLKIFEKTDNYNLIYRTYKLYWTAGIYNVSILNQGSSLRICTPTGSLVKTCICMYIIFTFKLKFFYILFSNRPIGTKLLAKLY